MKIFYLYKKINEKLDIVIQDNDTIEYPIPTIPQRGADDANNFSQKKS